MSYFSRQQTITSIIILVYSLRKSQEFFTSLHISWVQAGHALSTQSMTVCGLVVLSQSLLNLPSLNLHFTFLVLCPWPHVTEH